MNQRTSEPNQQVKTVTIIGAGPAGIAAAIQLKRWGLKPCLLERSHIGGLLVNANLIENYPGFPEGITGPELVRLFESHMQRIGVPVDFEEVVALDHDGQFNIRTSKREFNSRFVVIASGTRPREVDITVDAPGRVFYEVAPILDVKEKHIAVIGAGDAAFDYALNLSRHNQVTLLNRGQTVKCLPLLQQRVVQNPRIAYTENIRVTTVKSRADGMIMMSGKAPMGGWELGADYVIFAIGRIVQLDYLTQKLQEKTSELEKSGLLYFAGDVKNDIFRQTSIAVGDGINAAMRICRILEEID